MRTLVIAIVLLGASCEPHSGSYGSATMLEMRSCRIIEDANLGFNVKGSRFEMRVGGVCKVDVVIDDTGRTDVDATLSHSQVRELIRRLEIAMRNSDRDANDWEPTYPEAAPAADR